MKAEKGMADRLASPWALAANCQLPTQGGWACVLCSSVLKHTVTGRPKVLGIICLRLVISQGRRRVKLAIVSSASALAAGDHETNLLKFKASHALGRCASFSIRPWIEKHTNLSCHQKFGESWREHF